ncbi:hypothetical protein LCGC14_2307880 [marine sediment metagenome]|uniref:Uncharacterized protein n=1 Tax=marine sediment metagenome TaxID=412755 RepID=A0A0F9EYU4_9ZZZZ
MKRFVYALAYFLIWIDAKILYRQPNTTEASKLSRVFYNASCDLMDLSGGDDGTEEVEAIFWRLLPQQREEKARWRI